MKWLWLLAMMFMLSLAGTALFMMSITVLKDIMNKLCRRLLLSALRQEYEHARSLGLSESELLNWRSLLETAEVMYSGL